MRLRWLVLGSLLLITAAEFFRPSLQRVPSPELTWIEAAQAAAEVTSTNIFVDTEGNDEHPGTIEQPLKTPERAKQAARALLREGAHGVNVLLRGGTYHLTETLRLGREDSGSDNGLVTWSGYGDEKVTLSAALPLIANWSPPNCSLSSIDGYSNVASDGLAPPGYTLITSWHSCLVTTPRPEYGWNNMAGMIVAPRQGVEGVVVRTSWDARSHQTQYLGEMDDSHQCMRLASEHKDCDTFTWSIIHRPPLTPL